MDKIHRVWLGGDMPEDFRQFGQEWKDLNPNYQLIDWNEEMVFDTEWINREVIDVMTRESKRADADKIAYYTHVVDVIDYELIYRHGGWYFNCDIKPIKPLSTLRYDINGAALANEDDVHPVNMAMYCAPGHPFFKKVIELLPQRYFSAPGAPMNQSTGVQLLMQALGEYRNRGNIIRFHRNVFNPIHWSEVDFGTTPDLNKSFPPETVAVHMWLHRTNQRGHRVVEENWEV